MRFCIQNSLSTRYFSYLPNILNSYLFLRSNIRFQTLEFQLRDGRRCSLRSKRRSRCSRTRYGCLQASTKRCPCCWRWTFLTNCHMLLGSNLHILFFQIETCSWYLNLLYYLYLYYSHSIHGIVLDMLIVLLRILSSQMLQEVLLQKFSLHCFVLVFVLCFCIVLC